MDFLLLDPEPVTGESLGDVTAVACSPSDGSLWIGMDGQGLLRIGRNGRRIRYTRTSGHLYSDSVSQLVFLQDGTLYILDSAGALFRYSSVEGFRPVSGLSGAVTALAADASSRLLVSLADGSVLRGSGPADLGPLCQSAFPAAFLVAASDALYVCGKESGEIVAYSLSDGSLLRTLSGLSDPARCLVASSGGRLFAGTDSGLFAFRDGSWRSVDVLDASSSRRVQSLLTDALDRLWVATREGLCCVDVSESNVSKSELFFGGQAFQAMAAASDSEGVLYFGSLRGVAAVPQHASVETLPWVASPEPEQVLRHGPGFWWILWIVLALLLGLCIGRFLSSRQSARPNEPLTAPEAPESLQDVSKPDVSNSLIETPPVVEPTPARPKPARQVAPVPPATPPADLVAKVRELDADTPEGFVAEVLPIIRRSLSDPKFSVEDIASELRLSRVHVNRKLQAELGISPSLLIKAFRMSMASDLLLQNEIPVAEIASRTGFSSASYFSSAFREFFGLSPREYLARPDLRV